MMFRSYQGVRWEEYVTWSKLVLDDVAALAVIQARRIIESENAAWRENWKGN
jgi:hypothetical protein